MVYKNVSMATKSSLEAASTLLKLNFALSSLTYILLQQQNLLDKDILTTFSKIKLKSLLTLFRMFLIMNLLFLMFHFLL